MIESQLPRVLERQVEEQQVRLLLALDAGLPFFQGHFPAQPVLPGVAQLDWAIRFGCDYFGYDAEVATLEVLKFQQLMLPDTKIELLLNNQPGQNKFSFSYQLGDNRFASGRVLLAKGEH
ncbi:ApeI family dehydratase [Shewanella cyperi]|uniref:ApeI family dehydratase n=1 Tax=Shewanella cyperi TaxID=2814292 RepID=UPI001A946ECD|nr:thioester dehydrase [Shewanella cyperi]QSX40654.1 thioester dehydrase [Shewanella cyperi]